MGAGGSKTEKKPESLKVMTFNTWLLPSAEDKKSRLAEMPEALAEQGADIIFLQEVWESKHRKPLIKEMKKKGYYAHYDTNSSFLNYGNGLLIFSKYPFEKNSNMIKFSKSRTRELFLKKGVIHVAVKHPKLGTLDLYDYHFTSVDYDYKKGEYNRTHEKIRKKQSEELIEFVNKTKSEGGIQIIAGDMNGGEAFGTIPSNSLISNFSFPNETYKLLMESLNLLDSFRSVNPNFRRENGHTYCYENPYTKKKKKGEPSSRLDYVFIGETKKLKPLSSEVILNKEHPQGDKKSPKRLSDHYGVLSTFEIK